MTFPKSSNIGRITVLRPRKPLAVEVKSRIAEAFGVAVPTPTAPEASTIKGVLSLSPVSSLTLKEAPVPRLVTIKGTAADEAPAWASLKTLPVLAALFPDRLISAKLPVKPVEIEETYTPFPEVKELAL